MLKMGKNSLTFVLMVTFLVAIVLVKCNSELSKTIEIQCSFMNAPFSVEMTLTQRLLIDEELICPILEATLTQVHGDAVDLKNASLSIIGDTLRDIVK